MDKNNTITFTTDSNEKVEFVLLEQTKLNGLTYLLGYDEEDMETAYILKDLSKDTDETSVYEFVEDEEELMAVSKIFEELLDDVSIELE